MTAEDKVSARAPPFLFHERKKKEINKPKRSECKRRRGLFFCLLVINHWQIAYLNYEATGVGPVRVNFTKTEEEEEARRARERLNALVGEVLRLVKVAFLALLFFCIVKG